MTAAELLRAIEPKRRGRGGLLTVPAYGQIAGGPWAGWRYRFESLHVEGSQPGGLVSLVVTASQPHWPFPKVLKLRTGAGDFGGLFAVKGEKPRRVQIQPMLLAALHRTDDVIALAAKKRKRR
jgi:hypothetical protein